MYFISQAGQHDCAFTCLKILLANYHHDKNYLFLPCKSGAYSFKELRTISAEHHMETMGVKIESLKELQETKDFPFIVNLEKKKGFKHSVLLLAITKKYAKVFDPENGKRKILLETFFDQWDHMALIIKNKGKHERIKCEYKAKDFIDKKDKITIPTWQLLSGVSLLFGVYFINANSYFFVPIIFLSMFLIFEILFRRNLISALKRMDDQVFIHKLTAKKEEYFEVYRTLEKYRFVALTIIPNFLYTILLSIFVTAILIMNGAINAVYIILSLALAVIHVYVYMPYFKRKSNEIMEQENELREAENEFEFHYAIDKAHNAAYQLGISKNAFTYLEIAVLLMSIITIMAVSGIINIVYVVFYLCITVYLKDNFIRLLEYSSQTEDYDNALVKLLKFVDLSISNNSIE